MEPTFYLGGGNGVVLLEQIFLDLGWKRTKEKQDENYRFKWCELKSSINYGAFREGEQIVNHIPNCSLLTNKLGLLNSLHEYERVCISVKKRPPKLDFIPETYRLDDARDRETIKNIYQDGEMWICKPTGRNQGKGIFLVRSREELNKIFSEHDDKLSDGAKFMRPYNRIIQKYLINPVVLHNRKFDIRCYMLIASTAPYLVLYHHGYVRLSIHDYDPSSENIIAHLTNQFIQKKDPTYQDVKDDTTWSMEKVNKYFNEHVLPGKGIEDDWVLNVLPAKIKQVMIFCFNAVKGKLQCKMGYTDLYGFDFMIDEDLKVWLIEVNVNPCLATNCAALQKVVPVVVRDTVQICIECFDKSRRNKPLLPLQTPTMFQVIYNGDTRGSGLTRTKTRMDLKGRTTSPNRHSSIKSPYKEMPPSLDNNKIPRAIYASRSQSRIIPRVSQSTGSTFSKANSNYVVPKRSSAAVEDSPAKTVDGSQKPADASVSAALLPEAIIVAKEKQKKPAENSDVIVEAKKSDLIVEASVEKGNEEGSTEKQVEDEEGMKENQECPVEVIQEDLEKNQKIPEALRDGASSGKVIRFQNSKETVSNLSAVSSAKMQKEAMFRQYQITRDGMAQRKVTIDRYVQGNVCQDCDISTLEGGQRESGQREGGQRESPFMSNITKSLEIRTNKAKTMQLNGSKYVSRKPSARNSAKLEVTKESDEVASERTQSGTKYLRAMKISSPDRKSGKSHESSSGTNYSNNSSKLKSPYFEPVALLRLVHVDSNKARREDSSKRSSRGS